MTLSYFKSESCVLMTVVLDCIHEPLNPEYIDLSTYKIKRIKI